MKIFKYLILILPITACRHDKGKVTLVKSDTTPAKVEVPKKHFSFKPYTIADDFLVTDTGYYDEGIGNGVYAVIKSNNVLVDTIDLGYGMNRIDSGMYLYNQIIGRGPTPKDEANSDYRESISASWGDYILFKSGKKEHLNKLTQDFDDYFSSPSVLDGKICYWQIKKLDSTGSIKVSAAQFDPVTHTTISHYLLNDVLETDDSGYFSQPYQKNDTIYFDAGKDKLMKFSKAFQSYN